MGKTFKSGKAYPIETLPDDLLDDSIPSGEKWALRRVMFWNDCQGWWIDHASDFVHCKYQSNPVARYWTPCPSDPMTRSEILAERGLEVCPTCDVAVDIATDCRCGDKGLTRIGRAKAKQESEAA